MQRMQNFKYFFSTLSPPFGYSNADKGKILMAKIFGRRVCMDQVCVPPCESVCLRDVASERGGGLDGRVVAVRALHAILGRLPRRRRSQRPRKGSPVLSDLSPAVN